MSTQPATIENDFTTYVSMLADKIKLLEEKEKKLEIEQAHKALILHTMAQATEEKFEPIDIAQAIKAKELAKERFIAFEYFPPKTPQGVEALTMRMIKMKKMNPLYVDVTWGAGGSTSDLTTDICSVAQSFGLTSNMHLTCTNMPREMICQALDTCSTRKFSNILCLRGDPPVGQLDFQPVESGFACALDLIKFIREQPNGQQFSLSCAGYPEGHPNRIFEAAKLGREMTAAEQKRSSKDDQGVVWVCSDADFAVELDYLKQKVDAGAQVIVTQMFFDVQVFIDFVDQCRSVGITCPIVPGVICLTTVGGFNRMVKFCKSRVPEDLEQRMKLLEQKNDVEEMKQFGIEWGVDLCQKLWASGRSQGLHFYTMNLDSVVEGILKGLEWKM